MDAAYRRKVARNTLIDRALIVATIKRLRNVIDSGRSFFTLLPIVRSLPSCRKCRLLYLTLQGMFLIRSVCNF